MNANRKRELKKAVHEAQRQTFLKEMPFGPDSARRLFDLVDDALETGTCHHDFRHTLAACEALGLAAETILPWLGQQGGGCDCEVLANVDEQVESATRGRG